MAPSCGINCMLQGMVADNYLLIQLQSHYHEATNHNELMIILPYSHNQTNSITYLSYEKIEPSPPFLITPIKLIMIYTFP